MFRTVCFNQSFQNQSILKLNHGVNFFKWTMISKMAFYGKFFIVLRISLDKSEYELT